MFWMQSLTAGEAAVKPSRLPTILLDGPSGFCWDCFQNIRVQQKSDAGWKYSQCFFPSLLNKTWANRSVVTKVVFLSCCDCTCTKMLLTKKRILQSKSQNPWILLTIQYWREQYLTQRNVPKHKSQTHRKKQTALAAESSEFSFSQAGKLRLISVEFTKIDLFAPVNLWHNESSQVLK